MKHLSKRWIVLPAALAVVALAMPAARAEDPIPSSLSTDKAQEYLGNWAVAIEVMGRKINLFLNVADVDGQVGATLDSPNQAEPLAIANINLADEGGLELGGQLKFGEAFTLDIDILMKKEGEDEVSGTIKDKGGIFNAPMTGHRATREELASLRGDRPSPTEARAQYGSDRVRILFADLRKGNSDWERFQNLKDGEVYTFTLSRATKMYTDVNLHFGDVVVKKENVTEDYPGVYSLWLKKNGEGDWSLLFNEQPDIWGTRYDPQHDAAEVPLKMSSNSAPGADKFRMQLQKTGDDGGILRITWDGKLWQAPFTVTH